LTDPAPSASTIARRKKRPKRRDEARTRFIVGIFVISLGAVLLASLFVISVSEGLLRRKATVKADFATVTGLKENSVVQLAGKEIGSVRGIEFVTKQYTCDPDTEDRGSERTDDCQPEFFCAPEDGGGGLCAELERYTGDPNDYQACDGTCEASGYHCVTQKFRKRYPKVRWSGRDGWCVPFRGSHQRVEVRMEVYRESMDYIRSDSRATIASNGVLGDQLVNITVGKADEVQDGGHIQTNLSLMEELMLLRDRFDTITDNVDRSLAGLAGVGEALNSDRTKKAIQDFIANAEEISRQVKDGSGLVGALVNDDSYKDQFSDTLTSVRNVAASLENTAGTVDRKLDPTIRSVTAATDSITEFVDLAKDPNNPAIVPRLFHDGQLADDIKVAISDASGAITEARGAIEDIKLLTTDVREEIMAGRGTLGKLIKDPKAYDDLVKALGNLERNTVVKKLVRYLYEQEEAANSGRPTAAAD
jgi:ABC-type transporter Mla subunit MlaD